MKNPEEYIELLEEAQNKIKELFDPDFTTITVEELTELFHKQTKELEALRSYIKLNFKG